MFSRTCHVFRASVGAQQEALGAGLCDRGFCGAGIFNRDSPLGCVARSYYHKGNSS